MINFIWPSAWFHARQGFWQHGAFRNSTSRGISLGLQNIPRALHRQKFGLNFTWWLWIICAGLSCFHKARLPQLGSAGCDICPNSGKAWGLAGFSLPKSFNPFASNQPEPGDVPSALEKTPVQGVCGRAASHGDERERKMAQIGRKWLLPGLLGSLWVVSRVSGDEAVAPAVTNVCDFCPRLHRGQSQPRAAEPTQRTLLFVEKLPGTSLQPGPVL